MQHGSRSGGRARVRRRVTAVAVAGGMVLGAVALVPSAGADQVSDKRAEAKKVADQLGALQNRQLDLDAQAERIEWEQVQAAEKVDEAQQLVDETNGELDDRRDDVRRTAVVAYQSGNDSPEFDAFLTNDADDGMQKRSYLEARTGDIRDVVDALNAAQQKAADDKARLEDAQHAVEVKAEELEQTRTAAESAVKEQQALNAKVQGELQTLVAAEQARRAEEARVAAEAVAARMRAAEQAAAQQASARQAATQQAAVQPQRSTQSTPAPAPSRGGGTTTAPAPAPARSAPARSAPAPAAPAPRSGGGAPPVVAPSNPAPPSVGSGASGAISAARSKIGAGGYVWGASGPSNFDCSGIVMWAYAQVGVNLPHYSGAQYNMTTRISASQLQPGDLVFWGSGGSEHVALYMGGNQLVHAFGSGNGVRITPLAGWWKPPTGYGRLNY